MSKFEYLHGFESIVYGLAFAHVLIGISQMIYHRRTIKFYWLHNLAVVFFFLAITQTYYSLQWVSADTINSTFQFIVLRVLPLSLLFIIAYQAFPEKMEGTDFEDFIHLREKEVFLPMVAFNLMTVVKTIHYRYDQYLELGNGSIFGSLFFYKNTIPSIIIAGVALLIIFKGNRKWVQGFVVCAFIYMVILVFVAPTSK